MFAGKAGLYVINFPAEDMVNQKICKKVQRRFQMINQKALIPNRIRKINGSFAFIEHRFMQNGFFESLSLQELGLYIFLIMVSDRNGLSWYSYDKICRILRLTLEEYIESRNALIDKDLIGFDGHMFQVLSLPEKPVYHENKVLKTPKDMEKHDLATITSIVNKSLGIK